MDGRLMFDKVRGHFSTVALSAIPFTFYMGHMGALSQAPKSTPWLRFKHDGIGMQNQFSSIIRHLGNFACSFGGSQKSRLSSQNGGYFTGFGPGIFFDNKGSFCLLIEKALWNCKGVPEDRLFLRNCPTRRFSQSICCDGDIWSGFGWSSVAVVESSSSRFSSSRLKYWWNERRSCFYSPYHQQSIC